jgi:hypothetical protein
VLDIFKGSSLKRFRARSSSANWHKDKLTLKETAAYLKRMGFVQQQLQQQQKQTGDHPSK